MAKTRSMTGKENHDASSKKRFKICDDNGVTLWSDLNHDLLFTVMMQLRFVDFAAFSGVCKSWRSLAQSNKNKFLVSRPPMSISISDKFDEKEYYCHLKDLDGRRFKTLLPHSAGRKCIGFTCGYVVLFGKQTRDFWLVNLITRHELHFPNTPSVRDDHVDTIKAVLVYSPSVSGLVLVVLISLCHTISFSVAGTQSWNQLTSTFSLCDFYVFKGKIYAIAARSCLYEVRLDPQPKLKLLETKNYPKPGHCIIWFLNDDLKFYVVNNKLEDTISKMEWVSPAMIVKTDYITFCYLKYGFPITFKPELWADPWVIIQ